MSRDQCIDQSATSIQSLLNTNGASFDDVTRKNGPLDFKAPKHSGTEEVKTGKTSVLPGFSKVRATVLWWSYLAWVHAAP